MTEGVVVKYDQIAPFSRGDGVETRLMVGKRNAATTPVTTGTTAFPPGSAAPLHSHNCDEQVTILEGQAEALVGGEVMSLGPMDSTFVPANVPHYFRTHWFTKFPSKLTEGVDCIFRSLKIFCRNSKQSLTIVPERPGTIPRD